MLPAQGKICRYGPSAPVRDWVVRLGIWHSIRWRLGQEHARLRPEQETHRELKAKLGSVPEVHCLLS